MLTIVVAAGEKEDMIEIVFDFVLAAAVTVGIVVVIVQLHQYQ
jgi:hypothetical protein